jgi:hypothetical protein
MFFAQDAHTHFAGRFKNFNIEFEPFKPDYPVPDLILNEHRGYAYDPETPANKHYQTRMKAIAHGRLHNLEKLETQYNEVLQGLCKIETLIESQLAGGR